jgi:hypothetical protein
MFLFLFKNMMNNQNMSNIPVDENTLLSKSELLKLKYGYDLYDCLYVFIFCVFDFSFRGKSLGNRGKLLEYNVFTHLSYSPGLIKLIGSHSLDTDLVIITLYPDFFESIDNIGPKGVSPKLLIISLWDVIEDSEIFEKLFHNLNEYNILFHGIRWCHILKILELNGILVYGIKHSIRHTTNPLHIRLFKFLLLLFKSFDNLSNYSMSNSFMSKFWGTSKVEGGLLNSTVDKSIIDIQNISSGLLKRYIQNREVKLGILALEKELDYLISKISSLYVLSKKYINDRDSLKSELSVTISRKEVKITRLSVNQSYENKKNKLLRSIDNTKSEYKIKLYRLDTEIKSVSTQINTYVKDKVALENKIASLQIDYNKLLELNKEWVQTTYLPHINEYINPDIKENDLRGVDKLLLENNILNISNEGKSVIVNKDSKIDDSSLLSESPEFDCESNDSNKSQESNVLASNDFNNSIVSNEICNNNKLDRDVDINSSISKVALKDYRRSYSTLINRDRVDNSSIIHRINNTLYIEVYKFIVEANKNMLELDKLTDIQKRLELFLYNQGSILLLKKMNQDLVLNPNLLTPEIKQILIPRLVDLNKILSNSIVQYNYDNFPNLYNIKVPSNEWFKLSYNNKRIKVIIELLSVIMYGDELLYILSGYFFKIMSNRKFVNTSTLATPLFIDLGDHLLNVYKQKLYKLYISGLKKDIKYKSITYREFLENSEYSQLFLEFSYTTILHSIGGIFLETLVDSHLIENHIEKEWGETHSVHVYRLNKDILNALDKSKIIADYIHIPFKLPMIVKPKLYEQDPSALGGYILNDEYYNVPMIIKNPELKYQSSINSNNYIYNFVNNSSGVEFKINSQVLDFVIKNNHIYKFYIEPDVVHPLQDKPNKHVKDIKGLEAFQSRQFLDNHIINMAIVYRDLPKFFIPVRIDNRGRLYAQSDYLNYQGIELAKALLLFANAEKVDKTNELAIRFFKSYGVNLFGNGWDKKSIEDKILWIKDNEADIIDFKNGNLLNIAENKILFLAFCIEYNKYLNSLNNNSTFWMSDFPIQVDATCNGYQHLALLLGDNALASHLNLTERTYKDIPRDFYAFIALSLKDLFKEYLDTIKFNNLKSETLLKFKDNYERLYNLDIHRSLIKKPVMTIPYNVTIDSMLNYIKEEFELDKDSLDRYFLKKEEGRGIIWYVYKKNPNVRLTETDIRLLSININYIIYVKFPELKKLTNYFDGLAKYCNGLNINIPWILPSGLEIRQHYLEFETIKMKPFEFKKNTYNLKLPEMNKLNKRKQVRALMPNLVHSLDASSLALLSEDVFKYTKNFYSVHDCFATTLAHTDELINSIRHVYLIIYSNNNYLIKFDSYVKDYIKNVGGHNVIEPIKVNNKWVKFPDIKDVLNTEYVKYNYSELLNSLPVI